ncbi:MAG: SusD/RagB family nutrient-binding outer membrane lipoprotein [Bacteroidaceae bacterium]|nr:SusD/RagB family nutrient-binding outer membrane lipoprotein [Bacteroidaceae bacterium]
MKKLSIIAMLAASLSFSATSCDDYLDVNNNIDAPDYIEAHLYLSGICQNYQGLYYDIRSLGPLTQMMGTSSYSSFATHQSPLSDSGAEMFRVVYWLHGMNLENLINQSVAAQNWTMAGIGTAIKAFDWDFLAKYNVEIPYQDAYIPGKLSHSYDSNKFLMEKARELAYQAIEYLEMEDNTIYGTKLANNDHIYWGDKDKWIKFAYGVIVRNLAAISNKTDFVSGGYADELIAAAGKAFASPDDDATVYVDGAGESATASSYNNFWCPRRGNLANVYWQHDYAVQVMTGTVPAYDENTGDKVDATYPEGEENEYYPWELNPKQIVTDTVKAAGHFDPRMVLKLATTSNSEYKNLDNADSVMAYKYYGSGFTGSTGPIAQAPNFYGTTSSVTVAKNGAGRWLYSEGAPYIMMTYAELQFCVAEAYMKKGDKANALAAFKKGVAADIETAGRYIITGKEGGVDGDKIEKSLYNELAEAYVAGPYVEGLSEADFTLSHIMMQKWVALYPWGGNEAWVDLRKYHYDIKYTGDYPKEGDGWDKTTIAHKWDTDATKVYKGFYLAPMQVENRKSSYNTKNEGAPMYRARPRYNSEYMWNRPALESLKPISGMADNYHTSIPWFAYPGDVPESL